MAGNNTRRGIDNVCPLFLNGRKDACNIIGSFKVLFRPPPPNIFSYIRSITMILGRYAEQSYSNILTEKHLCLRQHFLNETIISRSHLTKFMIF